MVIGFTNWTELGFFPLQDHEDGVPLGMRQQLAAGRVISLTDPEETSDPAETVHIIGTQDDMGTVGDIWPWGFWQTIDRAERHTGVWAQSWAALTVEGGASQQGSGRTSAGGTGDDGPTGLLPIITSVHGADGRMKVQYPNYPSSLARIPQGTDVVVLPGMEETAQHLVMLHADPRIVVPNVGGPGECGTLFVDLQPDMEPCMDYKGREPGQDGRSARAQSMMRVIAINANSAGALGGGDYNGLAFNCALGQQESVLGYGMCWIKMGGGDGPITPRTTPTGPITPGNGRGRGSRENLSGDGPAGNGPSKEGGGNKGAPGGPGTGGSTGNTGERHDRDRENPDDWGTLQPKAKGGHGTTFLAQSGAAGILDGGAGKGDKHYIGSDVDGNPMTSSHVSTNAYFYKSSNYDAPLEFKGRYPDNVKSAPLKVEVSLAYDGGETHPWIKGSKPGLWRWWSTTHVAIPDTKPPDTVPPSGPITPGGTPTTGGPGPGSPTTPGGPTTGGPTTGGPTTRHGNVTPPTGGPTTGGPKVPGSRGPTTPPAGPGVPPRGRGGPTTRHGDIIPPTGGPTTGGPSVPSGPITPGGGESDEGSEGERSWDSIDAETSGTIGSNADTTSAFQVYHPMMEGFSAMSFRPMLWVDGEASYLHDPYASSDHIHCHEQTMPQVLAVHTFGGLDVKSGTYAYVEGPHVSRARGGTAHGGIVFTPPRFELEDYFGFGSARNVKTVGDDYTASYVMVCPGVGFALGTPKRDGGLNVKSIVIAQDVADTANEQLLIRQVNSAGTQVELFSGAVSQSHGEVVCRGAVRDISGTTNQNGQAFVIPRGDTSDRQSAITPIGGEIRVNTELNSGVDTPEFYDRQVGAWKQFTALTPAELDNNYLERDGSNPMTGGLVINSSDGLTIVGAAPQIKISDSSTDEATKKGFITLAHDDNAEEDFCIVYARSQDLVAKLSIGGGDSSVNAASAISFYVAANGDTVTGTELIRMKTSGMRIGGSGNPNAAAILECTSTTQGLLVPRMSTAQKNDIASPLAGLVIFDTGTGKLECFDGSNWQAAW